MNVSIELHLKLLLYSLVVGAALAALYDAVRLFRTGIGCGIDYKSIKLYKCKLPLICARRTSESGHIKKAISFTLTAILDLLYMLVFTAVVIVFLYHCNNGEVRWFALASACIGFMLYMKTVGRLTAAAAGLIIFFVITVFRYIVYFTVKPAVFVIGRAADLLLFLYRKTIARAFIYINQRLLKKKQARYLKSLKDRLNETFTVTVS